MDDSQSRAEAYAISLTPAFRPVLMTHHSRRKPFQRLFSILPAQAMALNEFPKLIGERAQPMMFLCPAM